MKKTVLSITLVLMLIMSAFVLTGCGEKKDEGIVGKWAYSSFVYTFNEDKSGTYDAAGTLLKFTYEVDNEKITFSYEGMTDPTILNYKKDGNKLIITDSFGKDVEYVKK